MFIQFLFIHKIKKITAPIVSIFSGSGTIAMRSIATKLVDQNDVGKIQSLFGICEGLAPLIYSSMYSQLYIATINTLPGAFYLLGAALISPAIFIFLYVFMSLLIRDFKTKCNLFPWLTRD